MNTPLTRMWKAPRQACTATLRLILVLGMLLVPQAQATGSAPARPAAGVQATGDDAWSALDTGVNNLVRAIAVSANEVYVGGMFTSAGTCTTGATTSPNGI